MKLLDLLQMTQGNRQPQQQSEGLGPIMQFLSQNHAPQMAPIHMPDAPDYGSQIMAHGMQKQDREDAYAEHLQAKADMDAQQAAAIKGHEHELTQDPQTLALLTSGDAKLVAQGLERANEEFSLQKKAQYNENPTFDRYQEALKNDPAKAQQMMEWMKTRGTNISVGDKFSDIGRERLTDEQLQKAGMVPGTVAFYDKDGIPTPIDVSNTADEGKTALHAASLDVAANGYMELLHKVNAAPGMNKNSLLSDVHNLDIPGLSNLALQNMSPEFQELDSRRALMIQGIEKEFSGAAGTKKEDVDYLISLVPNPHTAASVQDSTMQRFNEVVAAMRTKAGTAYTKTQQGSRGNAISRVVGTAPGYNIVETPDGEVIKQEGQRAWRNNNPGNIEYGDFAARNGAMGSDGRFAIFPTKEQGLDAQVDLLFNSGKYANLPLSKAISKYAPSFENNTAGYQNNVLQAVGGVNKPMSQYAPEERQAIVEAMHKVEGNKQGKVSVLSGNHPVIKSVVANSPANKEKNAARKAAIEERMRKVGVL